MLTDQWTKSSYSVLGHSCVETRLDGADVLIRDTKDNGHGPVLRFTPAEWTAFTQGVVGGEFMHPDLEG